MLLATIKYIYFSTIKSLKRDENLLLEKFRGCQCYIRENINYVYPKSVSLSITMWKKFKIATLIDCL